MQRIANIVVIILFLFPAEVWAANELIIEQIDIAQYPQTVALLSLPDEYKFFGGISEEQITVLEDNKPVSVQSLTLQMNEPSAVILLTDTSGSMRGQPIQQAKEAIISFIKQSSDNTLISIITFDDTVETLADFSVDKRLLQKYANKIKARGKYTVLNDAIFNALWKVKSSNWLPGGKIILLLSDGKNENSEKTVADVEMLAREATVPIYTAAYGKSTVKGVTVDYLQKLSLLTHGRYAYAPESSKLKDIYRNFGQIMGNRLLVRYKTSLKQDGAMHDVVIKLNMNGNHFVGTTTISMPGNNGFVLLNLHILVPLIMVILGICLYLAVRIFRAKGTTIADEAVAAREITTEEHFGNTSEDTPEEMEDNPKSEYVMSKRTKLYESEPLYSFLVEYSRHGKPIKQHELERDNYIGAGPDCNIRIGETADNIHCKIVLKDNIYWIIDMDSETGTFVNEVEVMEPRMLCDGDEITVGEKKYKIKTDY